MEEISMSRLNFLLDSGAPLPDGSVIVGFEVTIRPDGSAIATADTLLLVYDSTSHIPPPGATYIPVKGWPLQVRRAVQYLITD